ncbi:EF-hand domain-containing protein [Luteimonas sp. 3794]|uniref:EF-hand domain-containing protein n=1 Tax=Luteimonas sp. 3794 TaxID=2817730 RepID=UPI00285C7217|nr:EF-hand domain-containing protein [Luteimonas sp. 3794]MDR6991456.1 hypothetical protein [Luteimonas sp. 3794]
MAFKGRLSNRRIAVFATMAVLLLALGWLRYTNAAALSGMPFKEMDWNEDGALTRSEVLQGFFTVTAVRTQRGHRSCVDYRRRGSAESIRVECRTETAP